MKKLLIGLAIGATVAGIGLVIKHYRNNEEVEEMEEEEEVEEMEEVLKDNNEEELVVNELAIDAEEHIEVECEEEMEEEMEDETYSILGKVKNAFILLCSGFVLIYAFIQLHL